MDFLRRYPSPDRQGNGLRLRSRGRVHWRVRRVSGGPARDVLVGVRATSGGSARLGTAGRSRSPWSTARTGLRCETIARSAFRPSPSRPRPRTRVEDGGLQGQPPLGRAASRDRRSYAQGGVPGDGADRAR